MTLVIYRCHIFIKQQALGMALPELVLSGKYSDFTLIHGSHEFQLHQAIVCPQSSVITAALEGGFHVSKCDSRCLHCRVELTKIPGDLFKGVEDRRV